jgi:GGDEF domain-containing protein
VQKNDWPITFSIGAATFNVIPNSIGEMIREADSLMYEVKKEGKDMIRVRVI